MHAHRRAPKLLLFTLLVGTVWPSWAQQLDEVVAEIERLIGNSPQQAYEFANQHQIDLEGEPQFDLLFGIAAQASGHCIDAVYALERTLQIAPTQVNARYALVLCYLELNNPIAAKAELQELSSLPLDEPMQQAVLAAQQAIEGVEQSAAGGWHVQVSVGAGLDSNPNNGVEDEFVQLPLLGQVALFEESQAFDSSFLSFEGQAEYRMRTDQHSFWYAGVRARAHEYGEDLALNRRVASFNGGLVQSVGTGQVAAAVFVQPLWLESERYLDYYGGRVSWRQPISGQDEVGVELTLAQLSYPDIDTLDRKQYAVSFWYAKPLASGQLQLVLKAGAEPADESFADFNSRQFAGVAASYLHRFSSRWSGQFSGEYLFAEHDEPHPLFQQLREDELYRLTGAIHWAWRSDTRISAQAEYTNNSSEISLYDYSRSTAWISITHLF